MSRQPDSNSEPSVDDAGDQPVARALEHCRGLSRSERDVWLDQLERTDPSTAGEVRSLMEFVQADDFLNHRASNFVLACDDEPASEIVAGRSIAGYRLAQLIGEGGHGVVWMAHDQHGQRVAIKFLKHGLLSDSARRRFVGEQRLLKELNHPAITKLLDSGVTEAGVPYLVLEHVDGHDVLTYCTNHDLNVTARVLIMVQVLDGLATAHARGVVHRDIKPTNLLVSGDPTAPRVRLIDFGVAKFEGGQRTATASLTVTGQALGTTRYMSPEQAADGAKDIDASSDLYSAGVVLYELLTGHLPYDPNLLERAPFDAIRHSLPISCQHWGKQVPEAIESVLARALRKEPRLRFDNARAFASALEACLAGEAPESSWGRRRYAMRHLARRYWLPIAAIGLLVAGMSVATVLSTRWAMIAEAERDAAEFSTYRTTLNAVTKALEQGDLAGARGLLAEAPPSHRGPEWQWLSTMAAGAREIWKEDVGVRTLAATPDGWLLGLMTGELVAIDDTGVVGWRAAGPQSPLCALARSSGSASQNSMVVSGFADGTVIARNAAVPSQVEWTLKLNQAVLGVAPREAGWAVATSNAVYLVDATGGVVLRRDLATEATAFAADLEGKIAYLGLVDGGVQALRFDDNTLSEVWSTRPTQSAVAALAFMPARANEQPSLWIAWLRGGGAHEISAVNGRPISAASEGSGKVASIAVDAESGSVALGLQDGRVVVPGVGEVDAADSTRDHGRMARVACRGRELASTGWDGAVRVRELESVTIPASEYSIGELSVLAWSETGELCAAWRPIEDTSAVALRKGDGAIRVARLPVVVSSLARHASGWLVGGADGSISLLNNSAELKPIVGPNEFPATWLAEGGDHSEIWKATRAGKCFRIVGGKHVLVADLAPALIEGLSPVLDSKESAAIAHTSNGDMLFVSSQGVLPLAKLGEQLESVACDSKRRNWAGVSIDKTSMLLKRATGSSAERVSLETLAAGKPIWISEERVAVGHEDGTISILVPRHQGTLVRLALGKRPVRAMAFDARTRLAALLEDGTIRVLGTR